MSIKLFSTVAMFASAFALAGCSATNSAANVAETPPAADSVEVAGEARLISRSATEVSEVNMDEGGDKEGGDKGGTTNQCNIAGAVDC